MRRFLALAALFLVGCGEEAQEAGGGQGPQPGPVLVAAADDSGLVVFSLEDPSSPEPVEVVPIPGEKARDVAVKGDTAFVATRRGLWIVSFSGEPKVLGGIELSGGNPEAVLVEGQHAFLVGDSLLWVVDVSQASNPTLVSTLTFGSLNEGLAYQDGYLYVAGSAKGLFVVDVSDPANPSLVSQAYTSENALSVEVQGNYAFVGTMGSIVVFDVSDPTQPVYLKTVSAPNFVEGLWLDGNYLYAAMTDVFGGGFMVLDVSNPRNPQVLSRITDEVRGFDVVVLDGVAYLGHIGIYSVDVSNPSSPEVLGFVLAPDEVYGLAEVQ